jgi:hypothetical protein
MRRTPLDSLPAAGVSQWSLVVRRFPLRSRRRRACVPLCGQASAMLTDPISPNSESDHQPATSLRGPIGVITASALVICATLGDAPDILVILIVSTVFVLLPILLVLCLDRKEHLRAFSIGVLIADAAVLPFMIWYYVNGDFYARDSGIEFTSQAARVFFEIAHTFRIAGLVSVLAAPLVGIACVAILWGRNAPDFSLTASRSPKGDV